MYLYQKRGTIKSIKDTLEVWFLKIKFILFLLLWTTDTSTPNDGIHLIKKSGIPVNLFLYLISRIHSGIFLLDDICNNIQFRGEGLH